MASEGNGAVEPRGRLGLGCGLGVLVGGASAYGTVALVGQAWAACDVGVNASANGMFLVLVLLPLLWLVDTAVFAAAVAGVARTGPGRGRLALGLLVGVAALALPAWAVFAWLGTPADYPSPFCRANVPPWWPSWIPA